MSRGYCDLCGAQNHGQTHTCNPASALLSPPVSDPKAYARLAARLAEVEGQARLSNARAMELEAERDEARRRLAEVEAERDAWREGARAEAKASDFDRKDMREQSRRAEARADRLAQELEDAVEAMRKAARGPSPASAVTGFLARFPVKEGDGDD